MCCSTTQRFLCCFKAVHCIRMSAMLLQRIFWLITHVDVCSSSVQWPQRRTASAGEEGSGQACITPTTDGHFCSPAVRQELQLESRTCQKFLQSHVLPSLNLDSLVSVKISLPAELQGGHSSLFFHLFFQFSILYYTILFSILYKVFCFLKSKIPPPPLHTGCWGPLEGMFKLQVCAPAVSMKVWILCFWWCSRSTA